MADPDIEIQRPAGHANAIAHTGTDDLGSQPYGTPIVLTYTIANVGIEIDAFVFPDIDDGTAVNVTMTAQGGIGAQSWSLVAGALPGGLVLESNGQIHGTVDTPGSFNWTLEVSDSEARTDQHTFSMVVNAGTWSEELRAITDFSAIWSMDDASMRTVTGSDIDSLKETGGDTRFDLSYSSGTKPVVETRDGITVAADNESTVVFQAGASGTLANLWASGKGTLYIALYMNVTPVGDRSIFRSGDGSSYGLDIYTGSNGTDDRFPRGYIWDGGAPRQALSAQSQAVGTSCVSSVRRT